MYSFETQDIRFELIYDKCYEEDLKIGNPYNTILYINVDSFGFSGRSEWTVDFYDLQEFAYKLKKLYDDLKGELQFKDREYGSILKIECDKLGNFCFSGELRSAAFQKLIFDFALDQTFIKSFVETLYIDYGKNFIEKSKKKK